MYKKLLTTDDVKFERKKFGQLYAFFYICKCFCQKYNIFVDFSFMLMISHGRDPTKKVSFLIYHDETNEKNKLGRGYYECEVSNDYTYCFKKNREYVHIYYSGDDDKFTQELLEAMSQENNIYIERLMTLEDKYHEKQVIEFGL